MSDARGVLRHAKHVLLDFDGPVCAVFGGVEDHAVAARLRGPLSEHGITVPDEVASATDPFSVLAFAATVDESTACRTESAFRAEELDAVRSAPQTDHIDTLLKKLHAEGKSVSIVSNNSSAAVRRYAELRGLSPIVTDVVAREPADVARLKPNPYLVDLAIRRLGADPADCVMIGDSLSDVQAAQAAAVPVIAFANKPGKRERFAATQANAIVDRIADLISD
ncbi:MAG: HAD-IIIA family hydrolase [Actinophytocola sp.]|nr:HAD-IIIA family hydrolase [Actinophytocola sp.]